MTARRARSHRRRVEANAELAQLVAELLAQRWSPEQNSRHLRVKFPGEPGDWLEAARRETGPLAISAISIAEVAGGMRSGERREVNRLLAAMRRVPLSESVAWRAAGFMRTYRRSHRRIGLGDYLIAGTADVEGLELATLNVKHFRGGHQPRIHHQNLGRARPPGSRGRPRARGGLEVGPAKQRRM